MDAGDDLVILLSADTQTLLILNGTGCHLSEGFGITLAVVVFQLLIGMGCFACIACQSNRLDLKDLLLDCFPCCKPEPGEEEDEEAMLLDPDKWNRLVFNSTQRARAHSAHF